MEDWQLDFEWLRIQHYLKDQLNKDELPDMNAILFLIGIQELGRWEKPFSKEEKQDLMHIAVCRLLSYDGYYSFQGRDADGWPHWKLVHPVLEKGVNKQERLLKAKIIQYFEEFQEEE